jgi:hypothetical protein
MQAQGGESLRLSRPFLSEHQAGGGRRSAEKRLGKDCINRARNKTLIGVLGAGNNARKIDI